MLKISLVNFWVDPQVERFKHSFSLGTAMKKFTLFFFILFSLLGCTASQLKSFVLTPQLKGVQLNSFSAADKQASFDVEIYNPNLFDIPVSTIKGEIKLNQLSIGHIAATNPSNTLKSLESQKITIPIQLDSSVLMDVAKGALLQGSIN